MLIPVSRADASYSVICSGYTSCQSTGYSNAGYSSKQGTSYWAMYTGTNCTNYVAYRLVTTNGMPNKRPKSGVGNARDWGTTMSSITNSTPTVGAVAWWGRSSGGNHVAYIEKVVSSTEIWVSESNWSGAFDWRKITRSGSGWPDGFIHFADPQAQELTVDVAPELSSVPTAGVELSVSNGTWSPAGSEMTYAYQWLLDGELLSGATSNTITPTDEMLDRQMSVDVTASRPGYASTKVQVPAMDVWPVSLTERSAPTIAGTARIGQQLTADPGEWFPWPDEYGYRWFADGTAISGATSQTLTPTSAQKGKKLTVEVTARHPDYDPEVDQSDATAAVAS